MMSTTEMQDSLETLESPEMTMTDQPISNMDSTDHPDHPMDLDTKMDKMDSKLDLNALPPIQELLTSIKDDSTLTNTTTSTPNNETIHEESKLTTSNSFLGQISNLIITTTTSSAMVLSDQVKYTISYLLDWVNYAIHKMTTHVQYLTTQLQQYHHQHALVGFNYALQEIKSDFIRLLRMMIDLLNQYGGIVPYRGILREQVIKLVNVWRTNDPESTGNENDSIYRECVDLMNKGNGMITHLDQVRELLQSSVDKAQGVLNWTRDKMKWE
eukprot:NODE_87_length_21893_cov_0.496559.p10 type:complete len:270 gc:universal NODE_87_length_21893_cov_0.496559:2841-2032(-)